MPQQHSTLHYPEVRNIDVFQSMIRFCYVGDYTCGQVGAGASQEDQLAAQAKHHLLLYELATSLQIPTLRTHSSAQYTHVVRTLGSQKSLRSLLVIRESLIGFNTAPTPPTSKLELYKAILEKHNNS